MKSLLRPWIYGAFGSLILCECAIGASDNSVDKAIQCLSESQPLVDPTVATHLIDKKERDVALTLWKTQMSALKELANIADPAIIPVLIPYLGYSSDPNYTGISSTNQPTPDIETLRSRWPAFRIITRIPGAGTALAQYVEDSRNPIDYRGAAFHVLRYIDQEQFQKAAVAFDKEIDRSNSENKAYLAYVENGQTPFHGMHWYTAIDPSLKSQ